MESFVETEMNAGVGVITLSRAEKRNALKRTFIEQLTEAVDSVAKDETMRCLVLKANGSVFCAGMDLGEMQARAESESGKQEWHRDSEVYADLLSKLYHLEIPTIVALQGPVLAGGVGMVLACDMIIANENTFVMLPEPMRGITAAIVTPLLVHRVGAGPASHLLLSGERMSAKRAMEIGLIHDVVNVDQLDERVESLVASVMTGSRSALAITKQHIRQCSGSNINVMLNDSIQISATARETDDAREGLAAFLEKRKPNWQPE